MERTVITCDICGREVSSTETLRRIEIKVKTCFGYIMDSPLNGDWCKDCYNKITKVTYELKGEDNAKTNG